MEEILASIRRIISEDESASPAPSTASRALPEDESLELVDEEADDKIINDIARVLSGGASEPAEAGEEDILDLTAELGGLEPVEEEPLPLAAEAESDAVFEPDEPVVDLETVALELVEGEPAKPAPEPEAQADPAYAEPQSQPEPMAPPRQLSASEEAASALERAIAALRAGQVPTAAPQYGTQPSMSSSMFGSEPMAEPQPAPAPYQSAAAPEPAPAPEPAVTVTEFVEHTVVVTEAAPEEVDEPAGEDETQGGFWPAAAVAAKTNGSTPHEDRYEDSVARASASHGSGQTLEDSIKDMLRPMLKQWLEENMTRVLTAALQDEIRNDPARFQRD
jgi:cell pole-organizing protein PopZ